MGALTTSRTRSHKLQQEDPNLAGFAGFRSQAQGRPSERDLGRFVSRWDSRLNEERIFIGNAGAVLLLALCPSSLPPSSNADSLCVCVCVRARARDYEYVWMCGRLCVSVSAQ